MIKLHSSTKASDLDFLHQKINQENAKYSKSQPFGFFIKDDQDSIIAGANGIAIYGSIYTDILWVDEKNRKKGLGAKIMHKVHQFGISLNCKIATVQTMDF